MDARAALTPSPPPPPPPPPVQVERWLMLSRIHKEDEVPEGVSFLLAPVAPPHITTFTLSTMLLGDAAASAYIVAADNCGRRLLIVTGGPPSASRLAALQQEEYAPILGLPSSSSTPRANSSSSPPTTVHAASSSSGVALRPAPASPRHKCFVCDASTDAALAIPTDGVHIADADSVGIISAPGGEGFVIAELRFSAALAHNIPDATCTLQRFWSSTGLWTTTVLAHPQPARRHGTDGVFAHGQRLFWVDLASGVMSLDPFMEDPALNFIPLPVGYAVDISCTKSRCLNVSNGKLTFVVHESAATDSIKIWLLSVANSTWTCDYSIPLAEIWSDLTYKASRLPESNPVVGLVDPYEPSLVYLYIGTHIVSVNVGQKKVMECVSAGLAMPELSSRLLFAWPVPQVLGLFRVDVPEHTILNLVGQYIQRLQDVTQDREAAFHVGVQLSNLAAELILLNTRLSEGSDLINQALPYLELFGRVLDGPVALPVQSFVVLLKLICQLIGKTNTALAIGSQICSLLGLHLQRRHPNAQTGGRQSSVSILDVVTVRSMEDANAVISAYKDTKQLVEVEVEEDLGIEEARQIYNKFLEDGAYDLIRDSTVLLEKVQDIDEREWRVV